MEIKTVNRTIHPDTHKPENSYRVRIGKKDFYDLLVVNIFHENAGKIGTFEFTAKEIASYESIHFMAKDLNGKVEIVWVQDVAVKKMIL